MTLQLHYCYNIIHLAIIAVNFVATMLCTLVILIVPVIAMTILTDHDCHPLACVNECWEGILQYKQHFC